MAYKAKPLAIAFWSKVEKGEPDVCWPWTGSRTSAGYGLLCKRRATHISLELAGSPRPDDAAALHSCDNPICVNPAHLRWGDDKENVADMVQRKRHHANRRADCIRGHPLSGGNLIVRGNGQRTCRTCQRVSDNAYKAKRREQGNAA